jgi:2-(1,2-epoxy-1,2-dihydrophenyl)acetyl-CoA isomerase
MVYETIKYDVTDNVGVILFNRPDNANSLNQAMAGEIADVALRCQYDPAVRAVLLTAEGKMFCTGGDLKSFIAQGENLPAHVAETATTLHAGLSRFAHMDAPLVIAVNGVAAGAGFSIALGGDYVMAADTARFVSAYTASGLTPDGSSTYYIAKHVGLLRAKELMLTNRALSAEEACAWGLVNRVVPADQLRDEAMALARSFAAGPTKAFGATKRLLNSAFDESLESQLEKETRNIAATAATEDALNGLAAFSEKRKPAFKGE